jgi:hypothetical protein
LLSDDAAERQERPLPIGFGERLPKLGQRDAPGWLRWARGGTERVRWFRMRNLPGGFGPGVRRSNPPASRAPVCRLWAASRRVHKAELLVQSVCVFCNSFKGSDLTSFDRQTRRITPLFNPRRHKWTKHFRWEGPYLVGRTAIGRVTVALLHINDEYRVELREGLIAEGVLRPAYRTIPSP